MTKAFTLNFSMKALFFHLRITHKKRLPKLVRQPLKPFTYVIFLCYLRFDYFRAACTASLGTISSLKI